MVIKGKRGWMRIVEAFVALLFIAGVLLLVVNNNQASTNDVYSTVHASEVSILKQIQLTDSLRYQILSVNSVPMYWNASGFPAALKDKVVSASPGYLSCAANICAANDYSCPLAGVKERSVYADSVIITTAPNSTSFSPKQFKLFCWTK